MRTFLITFLKRLEELLPPPANCHHVVTFARYGSNESGWTDKLALQLNHGGVFRCFFLDDEDFAASPKVLASSIVAALAETVANEQLGVGPGQYTTD